MKIGNSLYRFNKTEIKFEPKDLWIGLYWTINGLPFGKMVVYKFYFCIIPMFPIIISVVKWRDFYN
jgi:hypothetical protein